MKALKTERGKNGRREQWTQQIRPLKETLCNLVQVLKLKKCFSDSQKVNDPKLKYPRIREF